jgi:hypothetical protein
MREDREDAILHDVQESKEETNIYSDKIDII